MKIARWVALGTAAAVLGVSPTHVGNLVASGKLTRHGTKGSYTFDIAECLRLRLRRDARRGHKGPRTQGESLLALALRHKKRRR
jgi:hypothetical protein